MIAALQFDMMVNRSDQRKVWLGVGGFGAVIIAVEILLGHSSPVAWIFSIASLIAIIVAIVKYCLLARRGHFFQD